MNTPVAIQKKPRLVDLTDSPMTVPPTPFLKKIGYGTGVGVYRLDRSPRTGNTRSPWALKKLTKQKVRGNVGGRLKKEAEILKKLNHPNIIGFRGYTTKNGKDVLAMEEGGKSLGDMIEERREDGHKLFTPDEMKEVITKVCKALNYLHEDQKLIHGDIKSYNILIKDSFKVVKLCDFGVSRTLDDKGEAEDYIGTECWSAPEALYEGPITAKADMFALGMTIWEMLTLEIPHNIFDEMANLEESLQDLSFQDQSDNYGTRPELPDNLGPEYNIFKEIFFSCTEEEIEKRASALDVLNRLQT